MVGYRFITITSITIWLGIHYSIVNQQLPTIAILFLFFLVISPQLQVTNWSHAGIYPAVTVDFVCFSWVIFVNLSMILRFSIVVHCSLAWVLGPRTSFCIGICNIFCIWPHVPASTAEVVSFLWSVQGRQSMIAARQIPKHTTSVWDQDHHQAFLWHAKTVAKLFLSSATNSLCIACLSPQNQAFPGGCFFRKLMFVEPWLTTISH